MSMSKQKKRVATKDAVTREIENWKVLAQNKYLDDYYITHNFLIPLKSGEGRGTIVKEMAKALEELELVDFASAITFLEMKLGDEPGQAKLLFENLREAAVFTNSFRGVVAVDISAYSEKLYDPEFNEFLKLAQRNNRGIVFIFFINRLPNEKIKEILGRLQTVGNTKLINIKETTVDELIKCALKQMETAGVRIEDASLKELAQIIITLRENQPEFAYFKSIKNLIDDIVYSVGTDETSDFHKNGAISERDLRLYKEYDFKKHFTTKAGPEKHFGF